MHGRHRLIESWASLPVVGAMTLGVAALSISYGACGALLAGLVPLQLRYSGVAIASNGSAMLSGCVPLVATAVSAASGNQIWTAAALFTVIALITVATTPHAWTCTDEPALPGRLRHPLDVRRHRGRRRRAPGRDGRAPADAGVAGGLAA